MIDCVLQSVKTLSHFRPSQDSRMMIVVVAWEGMALQMMEGCCLDLD